MRRPCGSYATTTGNEMITDAAGETFSYAHNGNLTQKTDPATSTTWTYSWDYRNRLTQIVETSGSTTIATETFTYDVFNNLIHATDGVSAHEHWTVFDGKNPYMDFNGSGTLTTHYLANPYGLNMYYARIAATGSNPVDWYITDLTGSIREIVNQSGSIVDQINYDPYGNIIYESNAASG